MPIEVADNTGAQGDKGKGGKKAPLVPIPADAPKRPDYKLLKADLDKIFEQIKVYRDQIDQIRQKADANKENKNGPRDILQKEKQTLIDKKREIGNAITDLRKKRNEAMTKVKQAREKARDDVSEIRKLNKELGELLTPEAVDKKIKELEFKLETGGVSSIKGEKKIMLEIKALQASRDKAASMKAKVDSVTTDQKIEEDFATECKQLQRQIEEKSIEFDATLKEIDETSAKISALSNAGEMKKAREERDAISEKITASYTKIDSMKEEFEKKKKAYEEWQVEYDKLCQAERERRRKEREEADRLRAEKEKERELELASIKRLNPHEEEINACESLIGYLRGKIAFAAKDERKPEKPAFDPTKNVAAGFAVMKRDDEDEGWLMGGKKKKADKPKAAPKPKAEAAPAKAKPVKHSHEKFEAFEKLGVKVPNNTDEVKSVIEQLLEKKKHFESFKKTEKEAIAEEKAEREKARLEKAAADAAAAAAATEEAADEE
eukprot:TRINITY_DN46482_c0_g1_i1.p1 TRINITY_DN46482_c0_g1~~TRINITY_DN46482_c0_g1_i1.p1  ORF type:complete len:493 (+),score=238.54 TRINITY_DN46482_c0_g1_i1:45-1523(+)